MLTYATAADLAFVKSFDIDVLEPEEVAGIAKYFKSATTYIDNVCRRRFFPFDRLRQFAVPTSYMDLRNRSFIYADLILDDDLLEPFAVQSGGVTNLFSANTTLAGNVDSKTAVISVSDAGGLDAKGATRFQEGTLFQIDNERFEVVLIDGDNLYCKRGALNTKRAAHSSGATIQKLDVSFMQPGLTYYPLELNIEPKYGLRVVFPNAWTSSVVWRTRIPQIFVSGLYGYHAQYSQEGWIDTGRELLAPLNTSATSFTLPAGTAEATDGIGEPVVAVGYLLQIGRELMEVTDVVAGTDPAPDTISVLRAQNGSIALPHETGDAIYRWNVPQDIRRACLTIAKIFREADEAVGGRQGVGEASVGVEIAVPDDIEGILKLHLRAATYG